jgi:hypothetical protein
LHGLDRFVALEQRHVIYMRKLVAAILDNLLNVGTNKRPRTAVLHETSDIGNVEPQNEAAAFARHVEFVDRVKEAIVSFCKAGTRFLDVI